MHISYHSLNVTGVGKTVLLGTKMIAKPINKSVKGLAMPTIHHSALTLAVILDLSDI